MAVDSSVIPASVEVARATVGRAVALIESARRIDGGIEEKRAAVEAMLQGLGVTHRWVGSRLDLLGTDGSFVIGVDLRGPTGPGGPAVEFQMFAGFLQWRVAGGATWFNLVPLADITSEVEFRAFEGNIEWRNVTDTNWHVLLPIVDLQGDEVSLQVSGDFIQWRLGNGPWQNLIALTSLVGPIGPQGNDAWSPVYAAVPDGERRVFQVTGWVGGEGTPPATGAYLGSLGHVGTAAEATDFRGPGGAGSGDMLISVYDTDGDGKVNAAEVADSVPWAGVTAKPTEFAPSAHDHDAADITSGTFDDGRIPLLAISKTTGLQTALDNKVDDSQIGAANGVASLDSGGKVPAAQLPSYVDDVLEYANLAAFPATGESGKIFVALDTSLTYRWSGSAYVGIVASPGSADSVPEGVVNLYFTAQRVRDVVLSGLSTAVNAAITATDSVLSAFGKLQAQLNAVATALAGKSDVGHTHSTATTSVAGFMSGTDKTKLDSVQTGATANSSDATLLNRTNHTGTQAISTVSGLQTALDGKEAADANIVKANADKTLASGYAATADNDGTVSGAYTPTYAGGNLKRIVNGGAITFNAPSAAGDYTLVVQITNSASAGAVTFAGFSKTGGDAFATTNGNDYFVFITKINGFTSATVQALQ